MGPPKKKVERLSYSDVLKRFDYFEYRLNGENSSYYLFNPYTGETIFQTEFDLLDRSQSLWAVPDKTISKSAYSTALYPETYASRRWGRRRFSGWENQETAATHIAAVTRGYLARLALQRYFKDRYTKMLCPQSGYYYFYDNYYPDAEPSWQKPRLAFPNDIDVYVEKDPSDYMGSDKYSFMDKIAGPYVRLGKLGKASKTRAHHEVFKPINPWREQAISRNEDIDLENAPLYSVIAWLEGCKAVAVRITEYAQMRAAICNKNWKRVLYYMEKEPDNILCQVYGFYSFSKTDIPLDDGILDFAATDVLNKCRELLSADQSAYLPVIRVFALHAMYNLLSSRAGRAEYFNVSLVMEQGMGRNDAVDRFINERIALLNKYLIVIPMETIKMSTKQSKDFIKVQKPTKRAYDTVELVFLCLSVLAHEPEHKEKMIYLTTDSAIHAIKVCEDEATISMRGMQYLYNLCYRSEPGQEAILGCDIKQMMEMVKHNHSGDFDCMKQYRRLELALKFDGWRGNVEEMIEKEMRGDELDSVNLRSVNVEDNVDDGLSAILGQAKVLKLADYVNTDKSDGVDGKGDDNGTVPSMIKTDDSSMTSHVNGDLIGGASSVISEMTV